MRHAAFASSFVSLAAVGLLAGCPDRSISTLLPEQGRVEAKDIPVNVNRDVDILFLIDDSQSMKDKQDNLAANFPKFIEVLKTIQGGLPNVHIGVVTSDLGAKGADGVTAGAVSGCANFGKAGNMQLFTANTLVSGGPFISDIQPVDLTLPRSRNYTGKLEDAFALMAKAGATGCGFEQHLEAMKQALQPSNVVNKGFLRDSAFLAVIFIADEDDCSMEHTTLLTPDTSALGPQQSFRCTKYGILCDDSGSTTTAMEQLGIKTKCHPNDASAYLTKVSGYVDFLKGLKSDPRKVIVAGIMGKTDPFKVEKRAPPNDPKTLFTALAHSCSYTGATGLEVADPPIRLKFFLDQFPNRSTFAQICQQDLSGGLQQIGDLLKTVIGNPCIEGNLADVDLTTPGEQYDCSVSSVTDPSTAMQQETLMPACVDAAANVPCWHLVPDVLDTTTTPPTYKQCPNSDHLMLTIENKDKLPQDTHVVANCVTEVTNN
jgi:hypothetical protein